MVTIESQKRVSASLLKLQKHNILRPHTTYVTERGDVGQTMSNNYIQIVLDLPIKQHLLLFFSKKLNSSSSNNDYDDTPENHLSPHGFWEGLIFMVEKKGGLNFIITWILGIYLVITFICRFIPRNPSPIPILPYADLFEGGLGFGVLYQLMRMRVLESKMNSIDNRIKSIELNLLGSLGDTYDEFKDTLQERLTKT